MRVNDYALLTDQIEAGLISGIRRLYKHDDHPRTEDDLLEAVEKLHTAIMGAICEYFEFPEPHGEA